LSPDHALELFSTLLQVAIFVSGPILMASLVAGVLVGVMQAATQINEASVSFIVKVGAVMMVLLAIGPALAARMIMYTRDSIASIEHVVR
jgi:flagellar biosynthetic protein FliQ